MVIFGEVKIGEGDYFRNNFILKILFLFYSVFRIFCLFFLFLIVIKNSRPVPTSFPCLFKVVGSWVCQKTSNIFSKDISTGLNSI